MENSAHIVALNTVTLTCNYLYVSDLVLLVFAHFHKSVQSKTELFGEANYAVNIEKCKLLSDLTFFTIYTKRAKYSSVFVYLTILPNTLLPPSKQVHYRLPDTIRGTCVFSSTLPTGLHPPCCRTEHAYLWNDDQSCTRFAMAWFMVSAQIRIIRFLNPRKHYTMDLYLYFTK